MTTTGTAIFWEQSTRINPHPLYAALRQTSPVMKAFGPVSGNPFWFLMRYEDCTTALKHPQLGKEPDKHLPPELAQRWMAPETEEENPFEAINRILLNMDPPDHTRLRALVHKAFTPRMVSNLRGRIQQIADDLLENLPDSGEFDLIARYAFPLPITVIAELLGVPTSDQDQFKEWSQTLLFDNDEERSALAAMSFVSYMQTMIDERQANPQEDLITALVEAENDGDTLDRTELLGLIFLLLVAGHETTVNLIANGTLALSEHPDQRDLLVERLDDADVVKSAIEEMLRYDGPVDVATLRVAYEPMTFGDKHIEPGDAVMVSLLAANRDPDVFPEPERFDILRENNKHIAFGNGIHYCVGAPLARLEAQIAIPSLLRRFPKIEGVQTREEIEWNPGLLLHGMKAFTVRV